MVPWKPRSKTLLAEQLEADTENETGPFRRNRMPRIDQEQHQNKQKKSPQNQSRGGNGSVSGWKGRRNEKETRKGRQGEPRKVRFGAMEQTNQMPFRLTSSGGERTETGPVSSESHTVSSHESQAGNGESETGVRFFVSFSSPFYCFFLTFIYFFVFLFFNFFVFPRVFFCFSRF